MFIRSIFLISHAIKFTYHCYKLAIEPLQMQRCIKCVIFHILLVSIATICLLVRTVALSLLLHTVLQ